MLNSKYSKIIAALNQAGTVILLSHVRPDGDAYGSCLGLGLSLTAIGKHVSIFNQDGLSPLYQFLESSHLILPTPAVAQSNGLLVALDTSTQDRLGATFLAWKRKVDWNIDHHGSNTTYAVDNLILPEEPATAAIICDLIAEAGWPLPPAAASALYVGLMTDTGSFRYRGTTSHTLQQAARLVSLGADPAALAQQCYQSISMARFKLQQLASSSLVLEEEGRLAYVTLTPGMFAESGALPDDTEGIVEKALTVREVMVSALFEQKADGGLKVSLRSKGRVNVSTLASEFGGGGHPGAAGINFTKPTPGLLEQILTRLRNAVRVIP